MYVYVIYIKLCNMYVCICYICKIICVVYMLYINMFIKRYISLFITKNNFLLLLVYQYSLYINVIYKITDIHMKWSNKMQVKLSHIL